MDWSRSEFRLSAVFAVIVGALDIIGIAIAIISGMTDAAAVLPFVGAVLPLASGILALRGRTASLLLLGWGWVLGAHLTNLLANLLPPHPSAPIDGRAFVFGPDYSDAFPVGAALFGLALYFIGVYRGQKKS